MSTPNGGFARRSKPAGATASAPKVQIASRTTATNPTPVRRKDVPSAPPEAWPIVLPASYAYEVGSTSVLHGITELNTAARGGDPTASLALEWMESRLPHAVYDWEQEANTLVAPSAVGLYKAGVEGTGAVFPALPDRSDCFADWETIHGALFEGNGLEVALLALDQDGQVCGHRVVRVLESEPLAGLSEAQRLVRETLHDDLTLPQLSELLEHLALTYLETWESGWRLTRRDVDASVGGEMPSHVNELEATLW